MNARNRLNKILFLVEIRNALFSLRRDGVVPFLNNVAKYFLSLPLFANYSLWIVLREPKKELENGKRKMAEFNFQPQFSLIISIREPMPENFRQMMISLSDQIYQKFELCVSAASKEKVLIEKMLKDGGLKMNQIKIKYLDQPVSPGQIDLDALTLAEGKYIGILGQHDTLAPFALYEIAKFLNNHNQPDIIYSDEDKISFNGKKRFDPIFKPDWSPDTFLSLNYIGGLLIFNKELLNLVKEFHEKFKPFEEYALILKVLQKTDKIGHIPKVLYHRRSSGANEFRANENKSASHSKDKQALMEYVKNKGLEAEVMDGIIPNTYRVKYKIKPGQTVSIIIPNKDQVSLLKTCISSIINKTVYSNFEIVIVDNQSNEAETFSYYDTLKGNDHVKIIKYDFPFNFSAINNFAFRQVNSDHLLFLNNDTEVISEEWLTAMLELSQRGDVGAVGAKLYFPDESIQHAGVVVGIRGGVGHVHRLLPKSSDGYQGRLKIIQNFSAVTAACMMVPRRVFYEVGGFDERLVVGYNDIDLCLKIRMAGYWVVFTPFAELYHYESVSRGADDTMEKIERSQEEAKYFREKWRNVFERGDPFYNPNLTLRREDFSIGIC